MTLHKSIEQHKADGTYRKDRHELPEIGEEVLDPKPYLPLPANSKKFFDGICDDLKRQKRLAAEDLVLVTNMSMLAGVIMDTYKEVKKKEYFIEGSQGQKVKNPVLDIYFKALSEFNQAADRLGIGPKARLRLALNTKELLKTETTKKPKVKLD